MPVARRIVLVHLVVVVMLFIGCAEPPEKEMQQAEGAIAAARAAGAEQYAAEEFAASVDALKRAREAAAERDYRLALNNALEGRERAENAARQGSDAKAAARANAERAISFLNASLDTAETQLKLLEASRPPAKAAPELKQRIEAARTRVQEARTALERANYSEAATVATAAAREFAAAGEADADGPAASRRRK